MSPIPKLPKLDPQVIVELVNRETNIRLDSSQGIAMVEELNGYLSEAYTKIFSEYTVRSLFPVVNEQPYMDTISTKTYENTLKYKVSGHDITDTVRNDIVSGRVQNNNFTVSSSCSISLAEMAIASLTGSKVDMSKLQNLRETQEAALEDIAFNGLDDESKKLNIKGLYDQLGNVSSYSLTADGTGSSTEFVDKDAEKIINDFLNIANYGQVNYQNKRLNPNVALIPPRVEMLLMKKAWSSGADMNIIDYIEKTTARINGQPLKIVGHYSTDTNAVLGDSAIIAYKADRNFIKLLEPLAFRVLSPELEFLTYIFRGHGQIAGVQIVEPKSVIKALGVGTGV